MTKRKPQPKKTAPAKKPVPVVKKAVARKKPVKPGNSGNSAELRKLAFAHAYIANGGNATEAAKTAGYSAATAASQGSRLLKDVKVAQLVAESARALANKYRLNADMVVKSIVQEITFDPKNLYREDGTIRDIHEMDEDTRAALAGVEFETVGSDRNGFSFVRKLKWSPKVAAREQAMKHLGMFEADNKQKGMLGDGAPLEAVQALKGALEQRMQQLGIKVPGSHSGTPR